MNWNEIMKIKDSGLREIHLKYFELRKKVFLDEKKVNDSEIKEVWNDLVEQENKEIELYMSKMEDNQ